MPKVSIVVVMTPKFLGRSERIFRNDGIQQQIPERDVQQSQADNDESHHRAATEGDAQTAVERFACSVSRTCRRISGSLHYTYIY